MAEKKFMSGFTLSPEEAAAMQSSDEEISSFLEGDDSQAERARNGANAQTGKNAGNQNNARNFSFEAKGRSEDGCADLAYNSKINFGSSAAFESVLETDASERAKTAGCANAGTGSKCKTGTRYAKAFYADQKDIEILRDEEEDFFASSERAGDLKDEVARDDDMPELGAKRSFWLSPLPWILLLILGFSGLQTVNLISSAFARGAPEGYAWSFAMLALFIAASMAVWREGRAVLMFEKTDKERELAAKIASNGTAADALAVCKRLKNASKTDTAVWNSFVRSVQPHFSPKQVFALYERNILSSLDEKAKKIIVRRSRENGVIVALSPVAWLDMALTLARSLRMIREIAAVYGYMPGIWGRIRLYKRVVKNIIFIGAADLATDALVDVFGAGIVGKLSSALGQGVAASVYSSRLGYMTVKAVRPLPFDSSVLSLGDLRREMLLKGKLSDMLKDQDPGK